jgi:hypothetical protein
MWTMFRPLARRIDRPASRGDGRTRRRPTANRARAQVESLEARELLSFSGYPAFAAPGVHPQAEVRTAASERGQRIGHPLAAHSLMIAAARKASFSLAQLMRFLPGKWHVDYDASSLFGPGARGVQEITFTGPKGVHSFTSTTGVVVHGYFGPAYYQFTSWGTYQFLNKKLLRLTITGASPIEYLNTGIIVMGGQSMPIQFQTKNQFVVQGQVYNRIPLNSGVF